jgi:RHS repeat-associated protein
VDANGTPTLNYQLIDKSGNIQTGLGNIQGLVVTDPDGVQAKWVSPNSLIDTLGQTVVTETTPNIFTNPGGPVTYQYTDAKGLPQTVTVNFSSYAVQTNFGCPNIGDISYTDFFPSTIVLADGETFGIAYEPTPGNPAAVTGRIAKLTLPLGGSISYTYSGGNNGIYCASFNEANEVPLLTRTVDDGRGNISKWQYANSNSTGNVGPYTVTVTDPLNNATVYTFYFNLENRRDVYQGAVAPQNLRETVITCYNGDFTNCPAGKSNPFWTLGFGITQTDVYTFFNGSSSGSLVETKYNLSAPGGLPTDLSGTVAEVKEYDFGATMPPSGSPVRDTITSYGSWNGTSCSPIANITDLPCVVSILNSSGNVAAQTRSTYNAGGHATQVSKLVSGSTYVTTSATYAPNGLMTSSTDARGTVTNYTNDACNGLLNTSVATSGIATSQTWDCNGGVVTSSTDANGNTTIYGYQDPFWRLTSTQYPDKGQTTVGYHPLASPPNITTSKLIDSAGNLLTQQTNFDGIGQAIQTELTSDPGGTDFVETTYDGLGRAVSVSNPHRTSSSPTDGTTSTSYDAVGRITQILYQDGSTTKTDYSQFPTVTVTDPVGNERQSRTDALGRLMEVDEPGDSFAGASATTTIVIGGPGQQTVTRSQPAIPATGSVTINGTEQSIFVPAPPKCKPPMPCGLVLSGSTLFDTGTVSVTVNGHTDQARFQSGSTPSSLASSLASTIRTASPYIDYSGVVVNNTTPPSATINLVAKTGGINTDYALSSGFTFDQSDFASSSFNIATSGPSLTGGQDAPRNAIVTVDSGTLAVTIGAVSAQVPFGGTAAGANNTYALVASALANALNAQSPPFTASAQGANVLIQWKSVGQSPNGTVVSSSSSWDSADFVVPSFSASGSNLSQGADAFPSGIAHPYVTLYTYDTLGNLLRVDQKGSAPSDSTQWRTRTFTFDSLSRLLTANNPESGAFSYIYDPNGNLLQKTSSAPNAQAGSSTVQTISYCYDPLNRVTGKAYSTQSCANGALPPGTAVATYFYDQPSFNGLTIANGIGKRTGMSDQAGAEAWSYDSMGRTSGNLRTTNEITKATSYNYNFLGNPITITYPSGTAIAYAYDNADHPIKAADSNSINYATLAGYTPAGTLSSLINGTNLTSTFHYNNRLQPCRISVTTSSNPVNCSDSTNIGNIIDLTYNFSSASGNNGNVISIINNRDNARSQSFAYDSLNRIASAQTNATIGAKCFGETFGYDAWGNLLNIGGVNGYSGCAQENLSVGVNPKNQISSSGYDVAGNQMTVGYSYDAENHLLAAGGATYTYDGDGKRVEKSTGILYWYGMGSDPLDETDLTGSGTNPIFNEYVFFNGKRIARRNSSSMVFYYFSDHLGSSRAVVQGGQTTACYDADFYPFGGERTPFTNSCPQNYKFTGKERDSESSLDAFGARQYSSATGRFISIDPAAESAIMELPQTWNRYSYVYNRPLFARDPDGRCPPCIGAVVGGLIEGGWNLGTQLVNNGGSLGKVNWNEVGANAAGGAVTGAIVGATGGGSLIVEAVAGAGGNVAGGMITNMAQGKELTMEDVATDAVTGFVGGAAGHLAAELMHPPHGSMGPRPAGRRAAAVYDAELQKRNRAAQRALAVSAAALPPAAHATNGVLNKFAQGAESFWNWITGPSDPPPGTVTVTVVYCVAGTQTCSEGK